MEKQVTHPVLISNKGAPHKQIVVCEKKGRNILARSPHFEKARNHSKKRAAITASFKNTARKVIALLKDKVVNAFYAKAGKTFHLSAYNTAMKDAFIAPKVNAIIFSDYQGEPGDLITIIAEDNVEVVRMYVILENESETILESGEAVMGDNDKVWLYRTNASNPTLAGTVITAVAYDRPMNEGSLKVVL